MSEGVILRGENLRKSYGGVTAVDDVSLTLSSGEVLGIVGPNGAGKTSLIDILTGIQRSDKGTLRLNGERLVGGAATRSKRGLARTFQHPQLCHSLSIRDNLLAGVAARQLSSSWKMVWEVVIGSVKPLQRADQKMVDEIAELVGLTDLDREVRDLTLGEQRLVDVGRALAQRPSVLLLDEPFAGSDEKSVAGIIAAVKQSKRLGHGVILVDHNIDLVAGVVDRMLLMADGRVAFDGNPVECMSSRALQEVYFGVSSDDG